MKILATSYNRVILDASKDELANLIGFYSQFTKLPQPGDEIKVDAMYMQMYTLASMADRMKSVHRELLQMAEALKEIEAYVPVVKVNKDGPAGGVK